MGAWYEAHTTGNPVPSIFASPPLLSPITDSIVVSDGGPFTFSGLDLAATGGSVDFAFTGVVLGVPVFNVTGTQAANGAVLTTEFSGVSADVMMTCR
jgi:hypothetical protein